MTDWPWKLAADIVEELLGNPQLDRDGNTDRVAAIIRRHAPDAEWRTIDSAPKDGTPALFITADREQRVDWWDAGCISSFYKEYRTKEGRYTHWRPLPNPPEGA